MTANLNPSGPAWSARRRARGLRITAVIVLLLGVIGAGMIFWRGTRTVDLSDDPSMLGNEKAEERQVEALSGKQGLLFAEWTNDLKRPGTQAIIIVVAVALGAGVCFYFARLLDYDAEHAD